MNIYRVESGTMRLSRLPLRAPSYKNEPAHER
jgi:hypothetical protein